MIFNKLRSQRPRELIIHRKVTPKGTDYEFYKFWLRTPPGAILNNEYKNEPLVYVASSSTTFYYRYFPTFGLEHDARRGTFLPWNRQLASSCPMTIETFEATQRLSLNKTMAKMINDTKINSSRILV